MNSANKKFGLGRGLEALLGGEDGDLNFSDKGSEIDSLLNNVAAKAENKNMLPLEKIERCPFQPRTEFDQDALQSLSDSIKEKGVLQPILVRRKDDKYEIIAGERRFLAAKLAGLSVIPAIIRDLNDSETLEIALIENIQRENLSAIEEAKALTRLLDEYGYTKDNLGKFIGKSRSYVSNTTRLLALPEEVQQMVLDGRLSAGHARALVGLPNAVELAEIIVKKGLSVRQVEELVAKSKQNETKVKPVKSLDYQLQSIADDLEQNLGLKVKINAGKKGKGSITLHYENPAQLSSILDILEKR